MGLLQRVSTVATPARMRATWGPLDDRWYVPEPWRLSLSAAGVPVTPDLAMALSAMYSGTTTIGLDLATLPAQMFRMRDDGGKDRVKPIFGRGIDQSNGIGSLAYMVRWQPNAYQTATEFWLSMVVQYLLREVAYAEIRSGPTGFMEQLLPRHPDRITPERLPSGRLRYKLREANGEPRYVTQDEMFVVRGLSLDGGLTMMSRVTYGAQSIGSALATQRAAGKFFKSGMTAAVVATYKGSMEAEDEATLHASISRYAAGVENSFGLLLVPDDVTITNLGVEPEKAQMMACVTPGTLLSMADGTRVQADHITVGDEVIAWADHGPCLARVASVFAPPEKVIYRLRTARGRELTASFDHPVLALSTLRTPGGGPAKDDPRWIHMSDLTVGMYVRVGLGNVARDKSDPSSFDTGWFMGALVGDGAIRKSGIRLTASSQPVVDKMNQVARDLGGGIRKLPTRDAKAAGQYEIHTGGAGARVGAIRKLLNRAGLVGKLAHTKRVPGIVYTAGPEAWRGFLSGYLDTDGTVQPDRQGRRALVSWTSVSRPLLEDCQHLLALLGVQSAIYKQSSRTSVIIMGRTCSQRGTWQLIVVGGAAVRLVAHTLRPSHPVKAERLAVLRDLAPSRYRDVPVNYDRVTSVERLAEGRTIGIEIEGVHTHITNGIVTHNSQEWGVREVARLLRLPGHKLGIKDSVSYNSQIQSALDYIMTTLRPIAITFEQAIQRDLILAKDTYLVEFLLAALMRGDFETQANYLDKFLRNRTMRPSEARHILNLNPDEELDELWKGDFRPGSSASQPAPAASPRAGSGRVPVKALMAVHDNAVRCLRRERAAVEKLARKHAGDVEGWQTALREFFTDQAQFVAQVMRMPVEVARDYCAQHGSELEAKGIVVHCDAWEKCEADDLAELALDGDERMAA